MASIQKRIQERLAEEGIQATVYGRVKHIYSIYRKMFAQNKTMDEIFDLYAFRVIVDDIPECYNVLGCIHDLFKPGAGPVQGLYWHPQAQHVPVPAHHGHRPGGHPLRGADPHLGDAPHGGIRRGRPLEVQAGHGQRQAGY